MLNSKLPMTPRSHMKGWSVFVVRLRLVGLGPRCQCANHVQSFSYDLHSLVWTGSSFCWSFASVEAAETLACKSRGSALVVC